MLGIGVGLLFCEWFGCILPDEIRGQDNNCCNIYDFLSSLAFNHIIAITYRITNPENIDT